MSDLAPDNGPVAGFCLISGKAPAGRNNQKWFLLKIDDGMSLNEAIVLCDA
jgi:hypothetical protein